jgi:6-phosphogluconate dehydrogenase
MIAYAQGMALLTVASKQYDYGLQLSDVAEIWRGGCIIRAKALNDISSAYKQQPDLANLLLAPNIAKQMNATQNNLRAVIAQSALAGIATPAMMVSLAYFDAYRSAWMPANLIQAQRDYFGSHQYERIDKAGNFHTQWEEEDSIK